jgi:hypothetical protein
LQVAVSVYVYIHAAFVSTVLTFETKHTHKHPCWLALF